MFIKNALSPFILIVVNLTKLTWTCILALLIESRKEISKDKSRRQLDYRERLAMFNKIIYVIVNIICFVDYDRVFLEALNALTIIKIYVLTCTLNFFRFMRTFVIFVQTCIVRCALEEISKIYNACGRYKFVETSSLFIPSFLFFVLNFFVLFSFSLINCVIRLNTIMDIVA